MGCGAVISSGSRRESVRPDSQDFWELTRGRRPTRIEGAEFRGLLPEQLVSLVRFMGRKSNENGVVKGWRDIATGEELVVAEIDFYNLAHWVLRPLTRRTKLSYVEAVAEEASQQKPLWFVSHWWGDFVVNLLSCLLVHQSLRELPPVTAYWVCAFAVELHKFEAGTTVHPFESSFIGAMQLSSGVLLVLDSKGPGTFFSRAWCCFETGVLALVARDELQEPSLEDDGDDPDPAVERARVALRQLRLRDGQEGRRLPLLLDVATVDASAEPHVLLEGLSAEEVRAEEKHIDKPGAATFPSGWTLKAQRELGFPLHVLRPGLDVTIEEGQTSRDSDRGLLLGSLIGRSGDALAEIVPQRHKKLDEVNHMMRSTFAVAAWRQALQRNLDTSDCGEMPLLKAISQDKHRRTLALHLNDVVDHARLTEVGTAIAHLRALRVLSLDISHSGVTSLGMLASGMRELRSLERLSLDVSKCSDLHDLVELGSSLSALCSLRHLWLNMEYCQGVTCVGPLAKGIASLSRLEQLALNLRSCSSLTSVAGLARSLGAMLGLKIFRLNVDSCSQIPDLDLLAEAMRLMPSLEHLEFSASHSPVTSLEVFGHALRARPSINTLRLNFSGSSSLSGGTKALADGLARLHGLRRLDLLLSASPLLPDIPELRRGLAALVSLQDLCLRAAGCKLLTNLADIAEGLAALVSLQNLELTLTGCGLNSVEPLGPSLGALAGLQTLKLDMACIYTLTNIKGLGLGLAQLCSLKTLELSFMMCKGLKGIADLGPSLARLTHVQIFELDLSGTGLTDQRLVRRFTSLRDFANSAI